MHRGNPILHHPPLLLCLIISCLFAITQTALIMLRFPNPVLLKYGAANFVQAESTRGQCSCTAPDSIPPACPTQQEFPVGTSSSDIA